MSDTVLITGGLGFLGQSLARHLDARGTGTILLDLVSSAAHELPRKAVAVQADVRDASAVRRCLAEHHPRFLIHAAAQLPLAAPHEIRTTTVDGTRIMLEAAKEHGVERFVFISSTAVYPPGAGVDRREDARLEGNGPYGEAKVEAEALCRHARGGDMAVTVLRPKSFLGPGRMGVFQLLFDWVEEGRRIPMIGNGENRYQLLDVEDLCTAIDLVLAAPPSPIETVFNVGAVEFGTVRSDLTALCDTAGTGAAPLGTPLALTRGALHAFYLTHLTPLYPWVYQTAGHDSVVPVDRIRALGWTPRYSNAAALIRSYQAHVAAGAALGRKAGPATGHLVPWKAGALNIVKHLF